MRKLSYFEFFFWMKVFGAHRETGELQQKKSSLKETGDVHLIKYSIFYLHTRRPWWASAHGYWTTVIDRTGHSTTQIHFKIRSYVWEACLVNLNLPCTKLCPQLSATLIRQVRSSRIDKITYTTLAALSLRPNFQTAFYKTNCNVLG